MRRVLILSATLSLASLLGSCGKNQCTHVVERACSDIRAKAQQLGTNKPPLPEDICASIDWKGREQLKKVCSGSEVQNSISSLRPTTPLKVAEAMCDGIKLHILTPTVEELTECRQNEDDVEAEAEAKKLGKETTPAEEPIAPIKPVSAPASSSAPTSAPAGTTAPTGTPITPMPTGATPAAPAGTPPAAGAPVTPPVK
jgi:hypothetical protein